MDDQPTRRRIRWDRDAVDGGLTSIQILLIWVTAEGNYAQWVATMMDGEERENVCLEIQAFLRIQGHIEREPRDINRKLQLLRRSYMCAHEFVMYATGAHRSQEPIILGGFHIIHLAHHKYENLQDIAVHPSGYARRVCPYWDLLSPVLGPSEFQFVEVIEDGQPPTEDGQSDNESTNTT
ncbi:hypothetical protein PGT21_030221 [Puccinia graminis f. sp. tritici]|uniref:Uncharacterized protein n=1 Tax=Puccinia graminis f. sp. tritici TaxID=56615 RepID=A0A5B0Q7A7_PUCGR|nr:hypothetical protein PGT21_030221 [Puccinia graminis f. sp. tritici]